MKIIVKPHDIQISETDTVNEGEYNITQLNFEFSAEYTDDLVKKAIFIGNDNKAYEMIIDNNTCNIPSEILVKQQSVFLGVYAYKITGSELVLRYSPSPVIFPIIDGSYKADSVPSEEITPSQFEQYLQLLQNGLGEVNAKLQEVINTSETLEENGTYAKEQGDYAKETTDELVNKAQNGDFDGATFTPRVDAEGNISWSNDKGLDNPQTQNIKGQKGDTGEPFTISKTYPSVEAMQADFDNMNVGDYVMITSSIELEDNAKLYCKTETEWVYITDFSGATGIQGEKGEKGDKGNKGEKGDTGVGISKLEVIDGALYVTLTNNVKENAGVILTDEVKAWLVSQITDNAESDFNTYYNSKVEEFNTNATEKTTAYNNNAEDKLSEYNTNATEKISEYNSNAEAILKLLPKTETEVQENIDIDDAGESSFNKLSVFGNSEQDSREGYNLFNYLPYIKDSVDGLTTTKDEESGYITINGTPNRDCVALMESIPVTDLLEDGQTYTLKEESLLDSNLVYGQIITVNKETGEKAFYGTNVSNTNKVTVDLSAYSYYLNIQTGLVGSTGNLDNFKCRFMFYKGTEDKAFELFGASPSPDYPQEIEAIGNNINLFDENAEKITYYINSNGEEINDSGNNYIKTLLENDIKKNYIISYKKNYGATVRFSYYNNDTFISREIKASNNDIFTVPETCNKIDIRTNVKGVSNLYFEDLKIEEGTVATSYSPYGMGSVSFKRIGKNYNKYPYYDGNQTSSGVNYKILENHTIQVTGSPTDLSYFDFQRNNATSRLKLKKGTYTFSATGLQEGLQILIYITDKNGNNLKSYYIHKDSQGPKTITFDNDIELYSFLHPQKVGYTFNTIVSFQIEKGTEATEYEPYNEDVYTLPVQQEMLTGDYIKDVEHHEWRKLIFDENSNMECIHNDKTFQFKFLKHIEGTEVTTKVICNMAKYWNMGAWEENGCFISFDGYFYILCKENEFGFNADMPTDEAITHFKTILANSKLIAYYKLATPINLELTEEQTAVLNQLEQFSLEKGINHIFSDDEISPKFKLKYYQDINILLDKINKNIADVSAQLIEGGSDV